MCDHDHTAQNEVGEKKKDQSLIAHGSKLVTMQYSHLLNLSTAAIKSYVSHLCLCSYWTIQVALAVPLIRY